MPWSTHTPMSQRLEFVVLATRAVIAFSELCRRFGVSRKTGYKWLNRYKIGGQDALEDHSRRPRRSPRQVAPAVAQSVIALRRETTWCGRKLRQRLQALGQTTVPAASTCTEILRRTRAAWPALPSADPGQGRALPPHAQRRAAQSPHLARPRALRGRVPPLSPALRPRAPTRLSPRTNARLALSCQRAAAAGSAA